MGGADTTGELVGRPLLDARRAPPGVATIKLGKGSSGGSGGRGRYAGSRGEGERDQWQEIGRGVGEGAD